MKPKLDPCDVPEMFLPAANSKPGPHPDWRDVALIAGQIIACDTDVNLSEEKAVRIAWRIVTEAKKGPSQP